MGDPRELEWAKKPDALKESWTARIGTHVYTEFPLHLCRHYSQINMFFGTLAKSEKSQHPIVIVALARIRYVENPIRLSPPQPCPSSLILSGADFHNNCVCAHWAKSELSRHPVLTFLPAKNYCTVSVHIGLSRHPILTFLPTINYCTVSRHNGPSPNHSVT